jgi:hypothetical protein
MQPLGKGKHKLKNVDPREIEEHLLNALWSLVRTLSRDPRDLTLLERVCAKFHEDDFRKLERLAELHAKYRALVQHALPDEDRDSDGERSEDSEGSEAEERLLARLDAGVFVLRLVDALLGVLATTHPALAQRLVELLTLHDSSPRVIARSLRRLARTLGPANAGEEEENAADTEDVQRDVNLLNRAAEQLLQLDTETDKQ